MPKNAEVPRVFDRDRAKQKQLLGCRNRQPLEGEEIHPDLSNDPGAVKLLADLEWMIEGVMELVSHACPEDLTKTRYYRDWGRVHFIPNQLEVWTKRKQAMLRECVQTGYEMVGWPVVYRNEDGSLRLMDGSHRLALKLGQGVPVRAIVQSQKR